MSNLLNLVNVLISNNSEALEAINPHVTVEAEYGDTVVEGSLLTLAHHGSRSQNPAPCVSGQAALFGHEKHDHLTVGVSHFDLDTLGGVLAVAGMKPQWQAFWHIAAEVDVQGPHRLDAIVEKLSKARMVVRQDNWAWTGQREYQSKETAREVDVRKTDINQAVDALYAFWAWSEKNRVFAPRDGSVLDITEKVEEARVVLEKIFSGDPELLDAGQEWFQAKEKLSEESLVKILSGWMCGWHRSVVVRKSDSFVNHLYNVQRKHNTFNGDMVLAYNSKFKSITLSTTNPKDNMMDCCAIMQEAFGPEAGGHKGIAGSPRGVEFEESDLEKVEEAIQRYWKKI